MHTPTASPSPMAGKVTRPAMLEIGVANQGQLAATIAFYQALLGTTAHPFRVMTDMLLLCVVRDGGNTQTVIYWEVPGTTIKELTEVYDDLIKHHKCKGVKKPHKFPKESGVRPDTEVCTLTDESGGEFGLVINPPVPLAPDHSRK